ncbi:hypothetical protein GX586_08035 [bacterium]|nr:hypothetical protein [bacterium]
MNGRDYTFELPPSQRNPWADALATGAYDDADLDYYEEQRHDIEVTFVGYEQTLIITLPIAPEPLARFREIQMPERGREAELMHRATFVDEAHDPLTVMYGRWEPTMVRKRTEIERVRRKLRDAQQAAVAGGERAARPPQSATTEADEGQDRAMDEAPAARRVEADAPPTVEPTAAPEGVGQPEAGSEGSPGERDGVGATEGTGWGRLRILEQGRTLLYANSSYEFRGEKRWGLVQKLIDAQGAYTNLGKNPKGVFRTGKALEFFDAAIEAEGRGRNGTGRYRIKP